MNCKLFCNFIVNFERIGLVGLYLRNCYCLILLNFGVNFGLWIEYSKKYVIDYKKVYFEILIILR